MTGGVRVLKLISYNMQIFAPDNYVLYIRIYCNSFFFFHLLSSILVIISLKQWFPFNKEHYICERTCAGGQRFNYVLNKLRNFLFNYVFARF